MIRETRTARVRTHGEIRLNPVYDGGSCSQIRPLAPQNQAPRSPPRQGPLGRLRPFRTARTPRGRQRTVAVRPADRNPKLGPAARHPRRASRTRPRHRHSRPARQGPRAGPRQPDAGPLGRRPPFRETPRPGPSHLRRSRPNPCSNRSAAVGAAGWHAKNWWRSMERYVFPRVGSRPFSEVNTADVLEILSPIWHVKAATAREVRQRIRAVLEWAIALDMRKRQSVRSGGAGARSAERHRDAPAGAAPPGRGAGHRDGAGVVVASACRHAGVQVPGA